MISILLFHAIMLWQQGQANCGAVGIHQTTCEPLEVKPTSATVTLDVPQDVAHNIVVISDLSGAHQFSISPSYCKPNESAVVRLDLKDADPIGTAYRYVDCFRNATAVPSAPFDVPPAETVTYDPPLPKNWRHLQIIGKSCRAMSANSMRGEMCLDGVVHEIYYRRTCADESRTILMSQDGDWHCYDFKRLGAR